MQIWIVRIIEVLVLNVRSVGRSIGIRRIFFNASIDNRTGKDRYVFYEGPPTANGLPHVGHAFRRTIKDIIARYPNDDGKQSTLEKQVWLWGITWFTPVELGKALGISRKTRN